MKTKPQTHTPTPWKAENKSSVDLLGKNRGQWTITDSKDHSIAVIGSNMKEDAEMIVRAVNSHQELLFILKDVRAFLGYDIKNSALLNRFDQAIAKAEEKYQ